MPQPHDGETQKDFVTRCIPVVIADGTAKDGVQAAAVCNNIFINHEKAQLSANTADAEVMWLDAEARRTGQYRKDVIKVGRFVHPSTGKDVSVSEERLKHWHKSFHEMQAAGINIPIRNGHDGDAIGHIAGATVAGNKLEMLHDFPDDGAVTIAKRNRFVSVGVVPTYIDAHGNEWKDVIEHVASTPVPVITGQSEFIALSRETVSASVETQPEEQSMTWLNEALGLTAEAGEDELKAKVAELAARPEKPAPVEDPAPALSKDAVDAISEATNMHLDLLQKDGTINKACRDKLSIALVGSEEKPAMVCLSRKASGTERSIAALVIDAIKENVVTVKDGEATGAQIDGDSLTLERNEPEDEATKLAREKQEKYDEGFYKLAIQTPEDNRGDKMIAAIEKYEATHKGV